MAKNLIVVESPAKVKTIRKFLGAEYQVMASKGHVRDLPSNGLNVDESKNFEPHYEIIPGKKKLIQELRDAASDSETVYLAPDPDREGEAIAWHIAELLKGKAKDIRRIQFNEITSKAVKEALLHPRNLDSSLFHAQQARRILDRLVGYKISPLLWTCVKRGISAGRVQSVALRLVVDREEERMAFVPEEYWTFKSLLHGKDDPTQIQADLVRVNGKKAKIANKEEADALEASLAGLPFVVQSIEEKTREKASLPPLITSTLQQVANQKLSYTSKRTMRVAQQLYEGVELSDGNTAALITYMRTDSTRISDEARKAAAEYIETSFGKEYLPASKRKFKVSASAQDAHEAIRPVDVNVTPDSVRESLSAEQYNIYALIWRRFVASQMAPVVFWDTHVVIACGKTEWGVKGQRLKFDGWMKVFPTQEKDVLLPAYRQGEELILDKLLKEQKFTQPPARYTEASLVKSLEELGIGRPSTYASIISTLEERQYVEVEEKHFLPTELGKTVCHRLVENFAKLMDVGFTASMEASLDKVADGSDSWDGLLQHFCDEFNPMLEQAKGNMKTARNEDTGLVCPECSKPLVIKFGKTGAFLACSGYPACRFSSDFVRDSQGKPALCEKKWDEPEKAGVCPECGKDLVVKKTKSGGRFLGCSGYPDCKHTESFSTGVTCPQCGKGTMVEKTTKRGKLFFSCSSYPDCTFATWSRPVPYPCPECGAAFMYEKPSRAGLTLVCPKDECGYTCEAASILSDLSKKEE